MSQCVPSWDIDGNASGSGRRPLLSPVNSAAAAANIPMLDYEVAELTWENGQVALHGLGLPRVPTRALPETSSSSSAKFAWDNKPRDGGTLESIVNPAKIPDEDEIVPWFNRQSTAAAYGGASAALAMDALVPCPKVQRSDIEQRRTRVGNAASTYTPVGSCSGPVRRDEESLAAAGRGEWSRMDQISVSGSARDDDSRRVTLGGFTSTTSLGSPENTKTTAGEDSVCHSKSQETNKRAGKSSVSTKRNRAAAIHNQSERKRRDKINQRMKTLQKLVPNSSKTDKASMLDEVIEYLKQLQAQVNMMSRMNMPSMMLPMAMQQQLQMSMMGGPLGMGMGMGIMDMNRVPTNMMPNPFMSMANASWDTNGSNDNPMAAFLACQSQPMTMDAYSRMATLYQQLQLLQQHQQQQQQPASSRKS